MKQDIIKNLRDKTDIDLGTELGKNRDHLWQLQADLAAGKVKNVRAIHTVKKTIAVIETILTERQSAKPVSHKK
ncbi:MAG: 50S ribosomal protein L29 [bacterium]|nr:50S ribosomal protein L29 [bacterium]